MAAKFDLEAMLAANEITQEQYDGHMKRRNAAAARNGGSPNKVRAIGGGIKSANAKVVKIAELDLLAWAKDLKVVQAAIESEEANENCAAILADLATKLETMVNPLRAMLPQLEEDMGRLGIEVAELQLAYAKADAEFMRVKRANGPEHKDTAAVGKLAQAAAQAWLARQAELKEVTNDFHKASRA
jgi:hypothetical protein